MTTPSSLTGSLRAVALAVAAAVALAGCSDPTSRSGAESSVATIRYALSADVESLDFARASDHYTLMLHELLSEPLVYYDRDLNLIPAAAQSYAISDGGATLRFTLRNDLYWHDGVKVTAKDVVHTFDRITDAETGDPARAADFNLVRSVEAIDDRTIVVAYDAPHAGALSAWATVPLLPAHIDENDPSLPVGCGPWILESWEPGERIVLRANAAHPYARPAIERLVFEILQEPATSFAALRAGRIDVAPLYPQMWATVRDDPDFLTRFHVQRYRILYYFYIAWRSDERFPAFADHRVRQAMTTAIDRAAYLRTIGQGEGELAVTSFHPDGWAFDPSVPPWSHDREQAQRMLDAAGWIGDADAGLRARDGVPFRFELIYPKGNAETERIALYVQDQLKRVGVAVVLAGTDWSIMQQRIHARDFDAVMLGLRLDPEPDPFNIWHSSQAAAGLNYAGLVDDEVDALIEAARVTFDRDERIRLYHALQARLHLLEPVTVFHYPTSRIAFVANISGFETGPRGALRWRPGPSSWELNPGGGAPD